MKLDKTTAIFLIIFIVFGAGFFMGYQMGNIQGYTQESLICQEKIKMLNESVKLDNVLNANNTNFEQNNYKAPSSK